MTKFHKIGSNIELIYGYHSVIPYKLFRGNMSMHL